MAKFGFIKDEQIINVKIKGKSYPIIKADKGIPCLLIGLGTFSFRTVSKTFGNIFEIIERCLLDRK